MNSITVKQKLVELLEYTVPPLSLAEDLITEKIPQILKIGIPRICLPTSYLPIVNELITVSWAGYPTGSQNYLIKAAEARLAVENGAQEIDLMLNQENLLAQNFSAVLTEIIAVREAIGTEVILKVICESKWLLDQNLNEDVFKTICNIALKAKVDFIQMSSGYTPYEVIDLEIIKLIKNICKDEIGIKVYSSKIKFNEIVDLALLGVKRIGITNLGTILEGFTLV